jgi:hypothetical protein
VSCPSRDISCPTSRLTDRRALVCSKESANCRLELNYAQQNSSEELDMIPLMMEANYKPKVSCSGKPRHSLVSSSDKHVSLLRAGL